jgi:hypothetical protein
MAGVNLRCAVRCCQGNACEDDKETKMMHVTSFTYPGDLSYGVNRPDLVRYSDIGLKWSAQEFKKVKAIDPMNTLPPPI